MNSAPVAAATAATAASARPRVSRSQTPSMSSASDPEAATSVRAPSPIQPRETATAKRNETPTSTASPPIHASTRPPSRSSRLEAGDQAARGRSDRARGAVETPAAGGVGALGVAAAIAFELRVPAARLRPSSSFLLVLNALMLAVAGWLAFTDMDHRHLGEAWLAGLAVAHLAVGLSAARLRRVSRDLGTLVLTLGVVLADTAFALIVSGPALAIGWAAGGVAFALILRRSTRRGDEALLGLGLGGHLALAITQALAGAAPLHALWAGPGEPVGAILSLSAIAAGCFVSARIAEDGRADWARALDILGLVVVAYLTAVSLDGPPLVVAWSIEAAGLAALARRTGAELPAAGAVAYVTGALAHALAFEAPPTALVEGLDAPGKAAISLGAGSAAALWCARLRTGGRKGAHAFAATGAVGLLYLASSALVTPFQPGGGAMEATLLDLGVREQGQLLLSVLWSVVGVVALVIGLRRDVRPVRLGALSLLLFTVAKVFLYDLSTLTSIYRVASFIGLGLVLLGAAYAWQRMRPEALAAPDRAR